MKGLGIDIIEISRIQQSMERHGAHFLNRLFTQREQDHCSQFKNSATHFAGRFAAKEAIVKALGTGFGAEVSWHDLEILNDEKGKPSIYFSERLTKSFKSPQVLISISHCASHATAVAVWYH